MDPAPRRGGDKLRERGRTTLPTQAERPAAPGYARSRDRVRRNRKLALRASHDRVVSTILQNAMLTALPEPDDLILAARYIANTEADQVGGDWYDAAVLPSGGTMIAMGDVVGHDITAAASMGQLRGLLRALAWDRDEPPAAILARVERAMPGLKVDHVHYLTPGSTLILYTDGLVERRAQPRENGIARLSDTLRRYHQLALDELLDEVIRAVAGNAPEDDIAVLGVSVGHQQHRRCP